MLGRITLFFADFNSLINLESSYDKATEPYINKTSDKINSCHWTLKLYGCGL